MQINKVTLTNFQLFKKSEIIFSKINLITGLNHDDLLDSGNGSGKTTILNGILFALYGVVTSLNIADLIKIGSKTASVELDCTLNNQSIRIIRTIPSSLKIFVNDEEKQFNTLTIAQKYLDDLFGDVNDFKMYRMMDNSKGINLLDLGTTSLRKNLMQFVDTYFSKIRMNLLAKVNDMEKFSIEKRFYKFSLSQKRLDVLKLGKTNLEQEINKGIFAKKEQSILVNEIELDLDKLIQLKETRVEQDENNRKNIEELLEKNKEYMANIADIGAKTPPKQIEIIDYDAEISNYEFEISSNNEELVNNQKLQNELREQITKTTNQIYDCNSKLEINKAAENIIDEEMKGLQSVKIGTHCDKCGSLVSEEQREDYLNQKGKELECYISSDLKIKDNLEGLKKKEQESSLDLKEAFAEEMAIKNNNENCSAKIREFNDLKFKQQQEIKDLEMEKAAEDSSLLKYKELVEANEAQIKKYREEINKPLINSDDIDKLEKKLNKEQKELYLIEEKEIIKSAKLKKTESYLMKLTEAFKFIDYKYTKADIQLYTDAIKTLDTFSATYIQEWLTNLSVILNDLLKDLNISVEFSADKSFMKVNNNGQELKYEQLSSGQKVFLNSVFKLSILLNNGTNSGLILIDEGINNMDSVNLGKFMEILKNLRYQVCIIYQNIDKEIDDVNYIKVERKNGESNV